MTHKDYIKDLSKLQDTEGKRLSKALLSGMSKLLSASGGNPLRFRQMLKVMKKKLIQESLMEVRRSQLLAKKLGKSFLAAK